MNRDELDKILDDLVIENVSKEEVINKISSIGYRDLGYAKIDNHRELRNGYPEVIYCEGKSIEHIVGIVKYMLVSGEKNILGTRASIEVYHAVREISNEVSYNEDARVFVVNRVEIDKSEKNILILTGGTADIPVAEEAAITAETFGNNVVREYDVGVAGLHRLLDKLEIIREANIIIVVAGMEGALASVVGGLVDKPVIAVPTSVGYGANFNGLAALLSMLNSCSSGITVVNIDNGFGAGYAASTMNRL